MRTVITALLVGLAASPSRAQTPSRDWRLSDRTVIGDFSHITAVAAALDRVYVTSPTALLVWHPQFRTWEGPYDPPQGITLAGVFGGLVDPLDQSLWLVRANGWVHFQPELQIWDQGLVSGTVVSMAFDDGDPVSGLYVRTRSAWQQVPRGGSMATPSRPPARPRTPISIDEVLRQSPTLQTNAAQILMDSRLGQARYTAAARSFDNLGWFLGTSGVGLLYLPDGAALPDRLSFGLPSLYIGAVATWPGGVWVGTNRTSLTDATLTYVDSELARVPHRAGAAGLGHTVHQDSRSRRAGFGRVGGDRPRGRPGQSDRRADRDRGPDPRASPTPGVYDLSTRQGRVMVGTAPRRRARRRAAGGRADRTPFRGPGLRGLPRRRFGLGRHPARRADRRSRISPTFCGRRDGERRLQTTGLEFVALADTLVGLGRDQLLWRNPDGRWNLGAPPLRACSGGCAASWRTGRASGWPGSGASATPGSTGPPAVAPRWRPAGAVQRPRGGRDLSLGRHRRGTGALPSRRYPAVSDGPAPRRLGRSSSIASARIASALGRQAPGLGDDCACSAAGATRSPCSTDASVEGVHFRLDWLSHEEVGLAGRRGGALRSRGRGAEPAGLLVAVTVPPTATEKALVALMRGVGEAGAAVGAPVLGGDLSAGPAWAVTVTVLGWTRRAGHARRRASGRPPLGHRRPRRCARGAGGVAAGRRPGDEARRVFAQPEPRIAAGRWLADHGARAMIDLSDGLGADAGIWRPRPGCAIDLALEQRAGGGRRDGRGAAGRRVGRSSSRRRAARTTSCW